jgi:hypothetical protein
MQQKRDENERNKTTSNNREKIRNHGEQQQWPQ